MSKLLTDKQKAMMDIAGILSGLSKCLSRQVGCIITNEQGRIIGSGYNGPPSGYPHCEKCKRAKYTESSGEYLEICPAVHAEINAIISCGSNLDKARKMFVTDMPCHACFKTICNTPIKEIYFTNPYKTTREVMKILAHKGIFLCRIKPSSDFSRRPIYEEFNYEDSE